MSTSEDNPDIRILKSSTTKSISGKSSLKYELGCSSDSTVYLRLTSNSSAGQFSPEWICIDDILKALAKGHKGSPLTSFLLEPLFKGKSVNTPAFLMAALTQERILRVLKGKKRGHEFLDPEGFTARVNKLVSAKAKPKTVRKATGTPRKTTSTATKKAAIKKRAVARKKTAKSG